MNAPISLRHNRYYPSPDTGHREDLLRITGVCDHCESEMYQREARKRLARVAENAAFEAYGPPF